MIHNFNKVVFWGHPLHTHTHSYIHAGFQKAFEHMGYPTYWFSNSSPHDDIGMDYENTLFMAMGEDETNIPLNKSSYYVLHNVDCRRYIEAGCKVLQIGVYTVNAKNISVNDIVFNNHTVLKKGEKVDFLCMCWATDLLPHEIVYPEPNKIHNNTCVWIGTYGDNTGAFQNGTVLDPFMDACERNAIHPIKIIKINPWSNPVSFQENRKIVAESYLAPTLQGPWQVEQEYIPCRIFKNISYGAYGITNSKAVNELFDNKLVYDSNPVELFEKAVIKRNDPNYYEELKRLMNEVKAKHTYLSRIDYILKCLPK